MASIKYLVKGKKNPSHLYIRFYHSKDFDLTVKTGILINPSHWNNKLQRFKTIAGEIPDQAKTIKYTEELRAFIVSEYNKSYSSGEIMATQWLSNTVDRFNNRPKDGADYETYFVTFVERWIEESKSRVNMSSGKVISTRTIRKYNTTLDRLKEYEKLNNIRLRHSDISLKFHQKFISYLVSKKYGNSTIEKYISQIKMFSREAEVNGYKINPEYKSRRFSYRRNKPLDPYLSIEEIQKIFDLEITDSRLDKIRDLFIVGLWTGLRISDFKEQSRLQIVNNNILISQTQKTLAPVTIPIHPQVQFVLDKRKGKLPSFNLSSTALEVLFNKEIKRICKEAGIIQKIIGDKRDKETNRNVRGIYPKHELVSSHICRRSFVTNHYGKLPSLAIMAITTHSSEKQLMDYVKISQDQYIEMVREHWEKEESKKTLKVV
ncbi:phage integrase SAM-like domain-containing protein [uncultured Psychroserpens sp.]|uniref:phage integrase SAM-like domain-containing protein n=1 Tax=uncultured Psychroserpens sp. TaxID=255436 RepID=UPI002603D7AA|nr:phage integrase SAM-like domain-containing protein [uncultured Psychroserpens sp.]